jgi:hypothetical protein
VPTSLLSSLSCSKSSPPSSYLAFIKKEKDGKPVATVDLRHLDTKAFNAAKRRMTGSCLAKKSLRPMACLLKLFTLILHKELNFSKKSARWVPKLLD